MAKIRFKINRAGIRELFTSPEVNNWLQDVGDSVAEIATGMAHIDGAEYAARAHNANRTAIVNVYPENKEAGLDNYRNNTLEKALGSSGLPRTKPKL